MVQDLSIEQAAALVAACKGERFGALFALQVDAGLRPSEGLALQWSDIDFGTGREYGLELAPNDTKTAASRRTEPVGPQTLELLHGHRAEALRAGQNISPRGIIFANEVGGYSDLSSLHRLRHTAATMKGCRRRLQLSCPGREVRFREIGYKGV